MKIQILISFLLAFIVLTCQASYAQPIRLSGGGTINIPSNWKTEYKYGATVAYEEPDYKSLENKNSTDFSYSMTIMSTVSIDLPQENTTIEQYAHTIVAGQNSKLARELQATLGTQIKNGYVTINGVKYFISENFNSMMKGHTCEVITYSGIINNKIYTFMFVNSSINQGSKRGAFYHIMTTFRP
ncbi:MAG: hypothetical protein MJ234_05640 [bacterium]|nr:hypothetical protein [bacterium]